VLSIRIGSMRPDQTMRLGIPGSTATVLPDHLLSSRENMWVEAVKITAAAVMGSAAFATVHMEQHFMQPWSSAGKDAGVSFPKCW
jgi:hypothetical protein